MRRSTKIQNDNCIESRVHDHSKPIFLRCMSAFVLFQPKQQHKIEYMYTQCCVHQLCFEWAVFPNIYTQFLFYYHSIARHTQIAPNIWQIHDSEPNTAHTQIPNQFICNMFNVNRLCAVANPLYWAKNSIKYVCLCVKFIILNPSTAQMVADSTNKSSLVSHLPQLFFVSHFDFSGNIGGVLGIDFI